MLGLVVSCLHAGCLKQVEIELIVLNTFFLLSLFCLKETFLTLLRYDRYIVISYQIDKVDISKPQPTN